MKKIFALLILVLTFSLPSFAFAIPVVPGAFGYGMDTRAAYACGADPVILKVKNLNDGGADSFRAAAEDSRPRVVVFETSGTIILDSDINIKFPCLTIAGQTAPNPGITIRSAANASQSAGGINVHTHDVLIQHLRVRPGDGGPQIDPTSAHNGIEVYTPDDVPMGTVHDVVIDHSSISWAGGKNVLFYALGTTGNATMWRSIVGEALYFPRNVNIKEPSDLASLGTLMGRAGNVSLIGNLYAHNVMRNPELGGGGENPYRYHLINNVFYDWGTKDHDGGQAYPDATFFYGDASTWLADIIGNLYIAGPATPPHPLHAVGVWSGDSGSRIFMSDNLLDQTKQPISLFSNNLWFDPRTGSPVAGANLSSVLPSSSVKANVLANAGARPANRDAVDIRIVNDVTNRTGGVITSQSEVGGWPTLAQNTRVFNAPANPHTYASNGYTNLENALHDAAGVVEGTGTATPPPPPPPPSPSGTKVPPTASITDNSGNTWTMDTKQGACGAGLTEALKNGVTAVSLSCGSQILWYQNQIYIKGYDANWYKWGGTDWIYPGSANDPSGPTSLPGDFNLDHIVNGVDWSYMNSKWFGADANADLNKDGVVNAIDFSLMNANWLKTW